jgi:hypothetical protein
VGVLWHAESEQEEALFLGALRQALHDLGYGEGRNIKLSNTHAAEQYDRFAKNALDLVAKNVDVIVAVTRPAALAAQRATRTISDSMLLTQGERIARTAIARGMPTMAFIALTRISRGPPDQSR